MTQDKTHWIPTKRAFPDIAEPEREQRKTEVEACYDGFIHLTSKSAKGDGAGASAVVEEAAGAGAGDGAGAGTSRCRQRHVSAAAARAAASALADLAAANA